VCERIHDGLLSVLGRGHVDTDAERIEPLDGGLSDGADPYPFEITHVAWPRQQVAQEYVRAGECGQDHPVEKPYFAAGGIEGFRV
jgi:hypothetical protein